MIRNFDSAWGKNNQVPSEVALHYQMLPAHDDFTLRLRPHKDGVSIDGIDKKQPGGVHLFEETT